MKLYLKDQKKYVDVSFWSILKAHIFSSIVIGVITYIVIVILGNIYYWRVN